MKTATAKLRSISPYAQSRKYREPAKADKESSADYEERTWRERLHYDASGEVFIPPMAFANSIKEAAKFLSVGVPGKGKATYTKHFDAGVMVVEPLKLGISKEDVEGKWLFVPADGRPGSGKRVDKCFPVIPEWSGTVEYIIVDETITQDVFRYHLEQCGMLIGIGFFRPRNRGFWGRFVVEELTWTDS